MSYFLTDKLGHIEPRVGFYVINNTIDVDRYIRQGAVGVWTAADPARIYRTPTEAMLASKLGSTIVAKVLYKPEHNIVQENGDPTTLFIVQRVYDLYPAINHQSFIMAERFVESDPHFKKLLEERQESAPIFLRNMSYLATMPQVFVPDHVLNVANEKDWRNLYSSIGAMRGVVQDYKFTYESVPNGWWMNPSVLAPYVQDFGLPLFEFMWKATGFMDTDPLGNDEEHWIPITKPYAECIREYLQPYIENYYGN